MKSHPNKFNELEKLRKQISDATGRDRNLDILISACLAPEQTSTDIPDYSSSVDACIALIDARLPGWHWHVGHGSDGILPYAALRKDAGSQEGAARYITATGPTVPLALLHAAIKAAMVN